MKKFLYFMLTLPLLLVGCNSGEDTPMPKPEKPSFSLSSGSVVEFGAEGGEGTISYIYNVGTVGTNETIEGDINPVKIACEAEWVSIPKEASLVGVVNYSVAPNHTTEPREATVTLSYRTYELSVCIKQAAGSAEPEPTIEGWGIVGSMNNWGEDGIIPMEKANGYLAVKGIELTTESRFKFIKDGDNAQNRGGNGLQAEPDYLYPAQAWGSDIRVSVAGTYDIYLNTKADTYYIMSEGKSPAEALEPLAPGEDLWEVYGNLAGDSARLITERNKMVAKGVKFDTATAEFVIRVNENEVVYGAKESATYEVESAIVVAKDSENKIKVAVEAGVAYDIYYRSDMSSLWVMPEGSKPTIWEEASGIAFSNTNFAVYLLGDGLQLLFDINSGVEAVNNIIPEGTYYVLNDNDDGFNFNLENEYDMRIEGYKTKLKGGSMTIKHISGGYDIEVDVESIHNHIVKVHYAGPLSEAPGMGRPITNPE